MMSKKILPQSVLFLLLIPSFLLAKEEVPVPRNPVPATQSYYNEGMDYIEKDDFDKAIEFFRKAIRESPRVPQLYNALGYALLKKNGTVKSASKAFEKAIELDAHYADPYFNLGTYYAGPGQDPLLATEYFEKAIQTDPTYSKAEMGLGWVCLDKKDAKNALEHFEKAVELDPTLVEAEYGLGLTYVALKKNAQALKPITFLRQSNHYDLAQAIEGMIQQGEPLPPPPAGNAPAASGGSANPSLKPGQKPETGPPAASAATGKAPEGNAGSVFK